MSHREDLTVEQSALILAMLSGDATPDEVAQIDDLLRTRPQLISAVVDMIGQEAWLAWTSAPESLDSRPLGTSGPTVGSASAACGSQVPKTGTDPSSILSSWAYVAAAAVVLIAAGGILGAVAMRTLQTGDAPVAALDGGRAPVAVDVLDYSARLIETSACRWGPSARAALQADGTLRQGESINLLEGIARLRVDKVECTVTLDIEGPAGLVLTADGGCSVSHGLVSADVRSLTEPFTIDTPSCQVSVSPSRAALGISVDGRDVGVHVFDGEVGVVLPWGVGQHDTQIHDVRAGEALVIRHQSNGKFVISQETSEPGHFASRTSMKTDHLVVPPSYREAVLSHDPLIYWRFDQGDAQQIPNHAGDKYSGVVKGKVVWHRGKNNDYVDFAGGVSQEELSAYIMASEPIDFGSAEDYSLELWMKPSHYHHCSLVAMFVPDEAAVVKKHGILLELGGPTALDYSLVEPGKVRFLHRSPPGAALDAGMACFSTSNYEVRQWQHVVAVKAAGQLKLYIDGQLVAQCDDTSPIINDLHLILGQLDDGRYMRRFVGQLDELALYGTALSEAEIQRHYNLVKNAPPQVPPAVKGNEI